MEQYISKSALVAEIKKLDESWHLSKSAGGQAFIEGLFSFLDTLEVKEADIWHLQEKENIYDAVKGWSLNTFACIMKDGTIQRFNGCLDEDCEGHIHVHIDGVNDDYDNVDDIVKWTDLTKEIEWVKNKVKKGE